MGDIQNKIQDDIKAAMKSGDQVRLGVLRMVSAAFKTKEIENRSKGKEEELTDGDCMDVLSKEAKKRKESIDIFFGAGRNDLAEKEKAELATIQEYLPQQMDESDVRARVQAIIKELGGVDDPKAFGKIMGAASKALHGQVDGSVLSKVVKEELGK